MKNIEPIKVDERDWYNIDEAIMMIEVALDKMVEKQAEIIEAINKLIEDKQG